MNFGKLAEVAGSALVHQLAPAAEAPAAAPAAAAAPVVEAAATPAATPAAAPAAEPAAAPAAAAAAPAADAPAADAPAVATPAHKPDVIGVGKAALTGVQSGDYQGAAVAVGGLVSEISKTEEGKKALADIAGDVQKGDYTHAAQAAFALFK